MCSRGHINQVSRTTTKKNRLLRSFAHFPIKRCVLGTGFFISCFSPIQVQTLEWFCRGCVSDSSSNGGIGGQNGLSGGGSSSSSEIKLISYDHEGTVILLAPDRIYLSSSNLSLKIAPLKSSDSGEFFCLVNEQRTPSLISRLLVQGRNPNILWS